MTSTVVWQQGVGSNIFLLTVFVLWEPAERSKQTSTQKPEPSQSLHFVSVLLYFPCEILILSDSYLCSVIYIGTPAF